MKIIIFGNSGLVGRELEKHLGFLGHSTIGISRNGDSNYNFDISEYINFDQITEVPDVVINCASILPSKNIDLFEERYLKKMFEVNVIGGANIIRWAKKKEIKKVINFSSLSINQKPWSIPLSEDNCKLVKGGHTDYAMSKLCQEKIMTEFDQERVLNIIHLRLSAVYGEEMNKQGIIFFLQNFIEGNKNIEITNGEKVSYDFIHVKDICNIIEQMLNVDIPCGIYNLGSEEEMKLISLANLITKINKSNAQIFNKEIENEVSRSVVDCSKLMKFLDKKYKFISLEKGLENLLLN